MSDLTSGRELPPKRELPPRRDLPPRGDLPPRTEPKASLGAPPPAASLATRRPLPEARMRQAEPRALARPDPRPMRVVYGAGAVAAMSVMAVGLVQPDWTSTADPGADAIAQDASAQDEVTATPPVRIGKTDRRKGGAVTADGQAPRRRVRHVTRYVYLKAGQKAPRGATVIQASADPSRPATAANKPRTNAATTPKPARNRPRTGRRGGGNSNNNPAPAATARPTPRATARPAPQATPKPTPKPSPVKTRQSGH